MIFNGLHNVNTYNSMSRHRFLSPIWDSKSYTCSCPYLAEVRNYDLSVPVNLAEVRMDGSSLFAYISRRAYKLSCVVSGV